MTNRWNGIIEEIAETYSATDPIPQFNILSDVHKTLHQSGCKRCDLGFQHEINGCCVSRGTVFTKKMIVGEAPGKQEDADGQPFTGPAGQLLDRIWQAVGWSTNDWYLTNVVKCRPVAERGSGRQNFTPKAEQQQRCRPYLDAEIDLLKPSIIVTLGRVATEAVLGLKNIRMGNYRGKIINAHVGRSWGAPVFPMLHPAAILHAEGTDNYSLYRRQTWEDIQNLKKELIERKIT